MLHDSVCDMSVCLPGLKVLVMESAVNILNACVDIKRQLSFAIEYLGKVDVV